MWLICAHPRQMGQRLSSELRGHRPFLLAPYGGSSCASARISNQKEQAQLDQLLMVSEEVQTVHVLLHDFLSMVRERKHQQLRTWMENADKSGIPELKSFVAGVERDYDAVKEALRSAMESGSYRGKSQQIKDHQKADVWKSRLSSPTTATVTCGLILQGKWCQ